MIFRRSAWGYADGRLMIRKGGAWFQLGRSRLTGADFNDKNIAEVDYIIIPGKIPGNRDSAVLELICEPYYSERITINVNFKRAFEARLSREIHSFDDSGEILITNHTGKDLMIDVACKDNFVKFKAKTYIIGKSASLPFEIRFSSFKASSLVLKKQLNAKTQIALRTISEGREYRQNLTVNLSGLKV
ncbi:MAG: hypothetical protein FWD01_02560 [Defluviitaleaceae bacterium]|nr:hypothetical protein [Defluviitaleaceae bacterium]